MLTLSDVGVIYGARHVVDGVSLDLAPGQWLMLCGPNGAGKSTLVKAIAQGVPYTGQIALDGQDIRAIKPGKLARSVGVLTQTHPMGYAFSVEEVVALGRYAYARGPLWGRDPEGAAYIDRALKDTGMMALRKQSMLELSGGEMQRAFLAQVFAQNPRLLILDEPANHLDLVQQKQLFSLIGNWLKAPGRAVISVVHDLSLARRYGTHAVLLQAGRVVAQGPTDAVLTRQNLMGVYGMDVFQWMRDLLGQWETAG